MFEERIIFSNHVLHTLSLLVKDVRDRHEIPASRSEKLTESSLDMSSLHHTR